MPNRFDWSVHRALDVGLEASLFVEPNLAVCAQNELGAERTGLSLAGFVPGAKCPFEQFLSTIFYRPGSVTTILKDTDSGSIIIPIKKNNTFTLPELQNKGGMTFTLLIGNNNLTDIIIKCDNDIINGVIFYFNSSMVVIPKVIDKSKSIKINSNNVIGDKIELISDSTRWIVTGSVFGEPNA